MRRISLFLTVLISYNSLNAQVNLSKGSLTKSIPIFSYVNPVNTNLAINLSIGYSSGNGLLVDQVSGAIGTNWVLSGLPSITRVQNGLPDDQEAWPDASVEFWRDSTKYPPGYLFNNVPISNGCPLALKTYPIFNAPDEYYTDYNKTMADRELDEFHLTLNGKDISFVLNKNDLNKAITLDKSKVNIKATIGRSASNSDCRTLINSFEVTDENGIMYEFSQIDKSKVFHYGRGFKPNQVFPGEGINVERVKLFDYGSETGAPYVYVANKWNISRIHTADNTVNILINYIDQVYETEYIKMIQTSFRSGSSCDPRFPGLCVTDIQGTSPDGYSYTRYIENLKGAVVKNVQKCKEISGISLPDGTTIEFNYSQLRKDVKDVYSMSLIKVQKNGTPLVRFELQQDYLVKNEIKTPANAEEEKWSRLCLRSIKKTSGDGVLSEKPYLFDYYIGSNNTENFVPPPFFHAQDPFGYYNGDYSGVPLDRFLQRGNDDIANWAKVCFYNGCADRPGDQLVFNPKPDYAKNGLLKSMTLPTGGSEVYEYAQNYVTPTILDFNQSKYRSCDHAVLANGADIYAAAGVNLSKIIMKNANGSIEKTTQYDYSNTDGSPSLWGVETGILKNHLTSHFQAEIHNLNITGCNYEYKFFGNTSGQRAEPPVTAFQVLQILNSISSGVHSLLADISARGFAKVHYSYTYNQDLSKFKDLINNYIIPFITSCSEGNPISTNYIDAFNHSILNTNGLPNLFRRATVTESSNGISNGKIVYDFTASQDFPLLVATQPSSLSKKARGYFWMYGLTKKITYYDNSGQIIKEVENNYVPAGNEVLTGANTMSCNCTTRDISSKQMGSWMSSTNIDAFTASSDLTLNVDFYNIAVGNANLAYSKETYFKNSNALSNQINYSYNNNNQVSKISRVDSKGNQVDVNTYYPEDYNLNNSLNNNLQQLVNLNKVNSPVSTETWITKPTQQPQLLSATVTEYGPTSSGDYKPVKIYSLQTDKPIPLNQIGTFDPDVQLRGNGIFKAINQFEYNYWSPGPKAIRDLIGNNIKSFKYNYPEGLPIASINNAHADECDYIPFLNLTSNSIFFSRSLASKACRITYVANAGNKIKVATGQWNGNTWTFTDIAPDVTQSLQSGMIYYEYTVPSGNSLEVRNENGCQMNELRYYPVNAFMETFNYDERGKKICETDINGHPTFYEYDGLGRLVKILDENHNIVKTYEYHYKN